jgi:hypothetical protein
MFLSMRFSCRWTVFSRRTANLPANRAIEPSLLLSHLPVVRPDELLYLFPMTYRGLSG